MTVFLLFFRINLLLQTKIIFFIVTGDFHRHILPAGELDRVCQLHLPQAVLTGGDQRCALVNVGGKVLENFKVSPPNGCPVSSAA